MCLNACNTAAVAAENSTDKEDEINDLDEEIDDKNNRNTNCALRGS